jgi:peptidyl-prolyl cis-trans isomerase C
MSARLCLVAATWLCACGTRTAERAERPSLRAARPTPPEQVVATVNGVPILVEDVARQAQAARQTPRQALRALVQEELVAQEAARRGLDGSPAVRRTQQVALANRLLAREFRFERAHIPRAEILRAYELNRPRYVHPEIARIAHVVALAGPGAGPQALAEARRLAFKARAFAAAGRLSEEEFKQIAGLLGKEARGVQLKAESLPTTRTSTAEEFAAAAFALEKPGAISPVVQTKFGFHVIYLVARLPARSGGPDDPEVDREIRDQLFERSRRRAFEAYMARIEKEHQVALDLDALAAHAARAAVAERGAAR